MRVRLCSILLGVGLALLPGLARAQLFSPGRLARAHASLEGLAGCKKCHPSGSDLSAALCLDCHTELAGRVSAGRGFHGRLSEPRRSECQACHREHRGREFDMVDWGAGREHFDHARTGFPLKGKHAKVACGGCHEPRRIEDRAVAGMLREQPKRTTFLGLSAKCAACHFDEHRGRLGPDCQKCHDEAGWKPAPRFDHARTSFPLRGKHAGVRCAGCHPTSRDEATSSGAFPAPLAATFLRMSPIEHEACSSCHEDPHKGSFGPRCASCHVESSWTSVKTGVAQGASFHDKTRFPLRGGHIGVECRSCHGPFPGLGQPARFKGLAFKSCSDCHVDAHLGQLAARPPARKPACESCHTVNRFFPALFELEQHAGSAFPLEGAHRAAACRGCHPIDQGLAGRIPAAVRRDLKLRHRPERWSLVVLRPAKKPEACAGCHADVHLGQLTRPGPGDPCARCHRTTSFADLASFRHDRDSRFALTGKHASVPCAGCHRPERFGARKAVRYRPLDTACGSCHADAHFGQFRQTVVLASASPPPEEPGGERGGGAGRRKDCDGCHSTKSFRQTSFDHNDPRSSSYPLEGRHARLACARCHGTVAVSPTEKTVRYRPLPRECEGCHVDYHRGEFRGFEP